jgi:hypothetical protein
MKAERGRVSPEQMRWLEWLRERGWRAFVAFGAEEAINQLQNLSDM